MNKTKSTRRHSKKLPIKACPECIGSGETFNPTENTIEPCHKCKGVGTVNTDVESALADLRIRRILNISLPLLSNTCWFT